MMKMRLKMDNRLHRSDTNKPRPIHGHEYTKYIIYHSTKTVYVLSICIKYMHNTVYVLSNTLATFEVEFSFINIHDS